MPVYNDTDNPRPVAATVVAPTAALTKVSAAGIPASGHPGAKPSTAIELFDQATAAANSAVVDRAAYRGPAALVIENVGTGSPTMTVNLMGSVDNVNFYNLGYALVATPNTVAVAALTITSTATTTYLLITDQAWRFLRVDVSSVTTETFSVTYYQ